MANRSPRFDSIEFDRGIAFPSVIFPKTGSPFRIML